MIGRDVKPFAALILGGVALAGFIMSTGESHAQALSTGCSNLNTMGFLVTPPNGFSGDPTESLVAQISTGAFAAGERVTVSVNTVTTDGISTLRVQNNANSVTLLSILLSDGASVTATVPAGFSGIDFVSDANDAGPVTNLVFQCAAAVVEATPDVGPGTAIVSNAVARTQTSLNNQNLQRHLEALTGNAAALDPRQADPGAQTTEPPVSGGFGANASIPAFADPMPMRGSGGREGLRRLADLFRFDSAVGLSLQQAQGTPRRSNIEGPETRIEQPRIRPNTNVWAYGSFAAIENDRNRAGDDQRFDGDFITVTAGADHWFADDLLAGLSLSYSTTDLQTAFNTGDYREDGYSLSPYFLYRLNDRISVNASIGHTLGSIDQTRSLGAVSSETEAQTTHATMTFRARHRFEAVPLNLVGRAGFLFAHRSVNSFVESDGTAQARSTTNTGEFRTGAEVNYSFNVASLVFSPFASTDWLHETMDTTNGDRDAFDVAAGVRWGAADHGLSGSIEATAILGLNDYDQYGGRGIVIYSFNLPRGLGTLQPSASLNLSDSPDIGAGFAYWNRSRSLKLGLDLSGTPAFREKEPDGTLGARLHLRLSF